MKVYKIIILGVTMLFSVYSNAQEIKLDTYKFGEGLNFTGEGDYKIKLSGYIQPYMEFKHYTDDELPDVNQNRFRMRRLRLRIDGNSGNQRFNYRFQVDLSGSSEVEDASSNFLLDAFISYDITSRIKATFGQRSTFTDNRELFMNSYSLQLPERSRLTSAFATIREFGLFLEGNFRTGGGTYLKPYFVVSNGDGGNVFSKDKGGLKVGGRLDFLPFGLFTNFGQFREADVVRELTPKLVIGVNYSYNNGVTSRRGRDSGRFLYYNVSDPTDISTYDDRQERLPDFEKYGIDFLFKYRGFSVLGEFVKTKAYVPIDINLRNDAYGADTDVLTDRFRGRETPTSDVFIDYTPEEYVRRQMMLGKAYNFQMGYLFKNGISIDGRYTHLISDEHSYLNNATFYNRPDYYTLGISKYLDRNYGAKIQASLTKIEGGDGIFDNNGNIINGDEFITRVILTITF